MKNNNAGIKGDGRRVTRVEKEVQGIASTYIIQKLQPELPGLVTVARVQIPGDLRMANVYVSLYQHKTENETKEIEGKKASKAVSDLEKTIDILQSWAGEIQKEISHKLKMKYVPKLQFFADESTEKILKIERILADVRPGHPPEIDEDDI